MTVRKSVDFFGPYIASTFNDKDAYIAGNGGMLSGGEISYLTATTVSLAPYAFVQDGVVCSDDTAQTVTVPDYSAYTGPVHIILSSPDAKATSGVTVTVSQADADIGETTIVSASRVNNIWSYPTRMSLSELRDLGFEAGPAAAHGILDGLGMAYDDGYGTPQGLRIKPGIAVDADGKKIPLQADGSLSGYAGAQDLDYIAVDPDFYKDNHLVARKRLGARGAAASVELINGDTFVEDKGNWAGGPTIVDATAGNGYPSVADNYGAFHVVVWANASDLKLENRENDASRTASATSTLAMGAAVSHVYLAQTPGIAYTERLYGVCSVGASGSEEIHVFRTDADGFALVSSHAITSMTNGALRPKMVIDENRFAHIVFQHDESGSGNNQVYYTKYNLDDAVFGTGPAIALSPRFAQGFNAGQSDTDPTIAMDSDGNLHIAWTRGVTAAVVGDINKIVIDQSGATVEAVSAISSTVGDGAGGSDTAANCCKARVTSSPQGDVYVAWISDSTTLPRLFIHESTLAARTGYNSVLAATYDDTLGTGETAFFMDADCDQQGRLNVVTGLESTNDAYFWYSLFAPKICSDGATIAPDNLVRVEGSDVLDWREWTAAGGASYSSQVHAKIDLNGGMQIVELDSTSIRHYRYPVHGEPRKDVGAVHEKDKRLATFSHEQTTSALSNRILPAGHSMSHAVATSKNLFTAVGVDGTHQGYAGLHQAMASLHGKGGTIHMRGGYYRLREPLRVSSGVKIVGDGHCVIDCATELASPGYAIRSLSGAVGWAESTVDASNYLFAFGASTDADIAHVYAPGDMVYIYTTGGGFPWAISSLAAKFVITGKGPAANEYYLNGDASAYVGAGYDWVPLFSGIGLENLTFLNSSSDGTIQLAFCYGLTLKDLDIEGAGATSGDVLNLSDLVKSSLNNVHVSGTNSVGSDPSLIYPYKLRLSNVTAEGAIDLSHHEDLIVSGSHADSWNINNQISAPVWINNSGTVSSDNMSTFTEWQGGGKSYFEEIVPNNSAAALAAGNVDGNFVSISADDLGTSLKRWGDAYTADVFSTDLHILDTDRTWSFESAAEVATYHEMKMRARDATNEPGVALLAADTAAAGTPPASVITSVRPRGDTVALSVDDFAARQVGDGGTIDFEERTTLETATHVSNVWSAFENEVARINMGAGATSRPGFLLQDGYTYHVTGKTVHMLLPFSGIGPASDGWVQTPRVDVSSGYDSALYSSTADAVINIDFFDFPEGAELESISVCWDAVSSTTPITMYAGRHTRPAISVGSATAWSTAAVNAGTSSVQYPSTTTGERIDQITAASSTGWSKSDDKLIISFQRDSTTNACEIFWVATEWTYNKVNPWPES